MQTFVSLPYDVLDDLKLICVLANFVKSVQGLLRVFKVLFLLQMMCLMT